MRLLLALLLAGSAHAAHVCETNGQKAPNDIWNPSVQPTEAPVVVWVSPGVARRIDGASTPLLVMYCGQGTSPTLGTLVWAAGETGDKTVQNLIKTGPTGTLTLPGSVVTL